MILSSLLITCLGLNLGLDLSLSPHFGISYDMFANFPSSFGASFVTVHLQSIILFNVPKADKNVVKFYYRYSLKMPKLYLNSCT